MHGHTLVVTETMKEVAFDVEVYQVRRSTDQALETHL